MNIKMGIPYGDLVSFKENVDLLTALRRTINQEGDLYVNGRLVFSALGLSDEDNLESLKDYGIIRVDRKYQYADSSKNEFKIYVSILEYYWYQEKCMDIKLFDYKTQESDLEFNSIDEVLKYLKENVYPNYHESNIHITTFMVQNGCRSLNLELKEIPPYYKIKNMEEVDVSRIIGEIKIESERSEGHVFVHFVDKENGYMFTSSERFTHPTASRVFQDDKGKFIRQTCLPTRVYVDQFI